MELVRVPVEMEHMLFMDRYPSLSLSLSHIHDINVVVVLFN